MTRALKTVICLQSLVLTVMVLAILVVGGQHTVTSRTGGENHGILDRFDMFVTNSLSEALEGVLSIKKVYWLSDSDLVAPEPNQDCYGEAETAAELTWLLEDAQELLQGQETLFSPDVKLSYGSKVHYYLDETIFTVTWKQVMDNAVYTISEVKIADPSQFRRFLAGGEFGTSQKYVTTEMARSVNAVVASSGDFYAFRNMGIIVYNGELMRMEGREMDSLIVDKNGDLQIVMQGEILDEETAKAYVEQTGARFSLAFGPALIENGELLPKKYAYPVAEMKVANARAALCQMDTLHYLLVAVSAEPPYKYGHTLDQFAKNLHKLGCRTAYNLDGGQTATIVMNDQLINYVYERQISDIIYFATALPEGE